MLIICCMDAGNYLGRGKQYVLNLLGGVADRGAAHSARFVLFTDRYTEDWGVQGMEIRPLPHEGLDGWMNKLALFKKGVFYPGQHVLYLDLDTVITGELDDIAAYQGQFAMLEDMYFPEQLGSGVMAWCVGMGEHRIWESYLGAGYPDVEGGDQAWIAQALDGRADRLQDLYPGQIASYKVSGGVLAPQTRIVCFHGTPRPHEVHEGWVPVMWNR